jgi:GDP-mannose 6-dehydrogenase
MESAEWKEQLPSIAVFGLGYVGCVTAACFSELGYRVIGVDVDSRKVRAVLDGVSPFYEPGLEPLIKSNLQKGNLTATSSTDSALREAQFAFLCVGTPSGSNGNLSLDQLRRVTADIADHLPGRTLPLTIVVRSTVFPGTCDQLLTPLAQQNSLISVVANPEFLREGTAVKDFMEPSLLVVGSLDRAAAQRVSALYAPLSADVALVAVRTAELIKYVCNSFHALKITFANEIGTLASSLGLEGEEVMETMCRDSKLNISKAYLKPGFAFGGSCLPKDLRALNYRARQLDLDLPLLNSVLPSNEAHISRSLRRVVESGYRKFGVYGLAFKPHTDDLRESPAVALIERLIGKGYDLKIYDPHIQLDAIYGSNRAFLLTSLPHIGKCMEESLEAVLDWADMLVVAQEPVPAAKAIIERSSAPVLNITRAEAPPLALAEAV